MPVPSAPSPCGLRPQLGAAALPRALTGVPAVLQARRIQERGLAEPCLPACQHSLRVRLQNSRSQHRSQVASAAATKPQVITMSEPAKKSLDRTANACHRVGWISFWAQLSLSVVSAGILLFSVAFTSQNGPSVTLYLTLFGIGASFLSTFWAYQYTRLAKRLRLYATRGPQGAEGRLTKASVRKQLWQGSAINLVGMGATLLGLQATVGLLVAKTLTNATANPFLSGGQGAYNPVLALDVFLVQASTNTLLAHFASLLFSLWLIRVVGSPGPVSQGPWPATA